MSGQSLYTYVWNNPTNDVDPTGFKDEPSQTPPPPPPPAPTDCDVLCKLKKAIEQGYTGFFKDANGGISATPPSSNYTANATGTTQSAAQGSAGSGSVVKGGALNSAAQTLRNNANMFQRLSETPDEDLYWFQRAGPFDPRPQWAATAAELDLQARALQGDGAAIGMIAGEILAPFAAAGASSMAMQRQSGAGTARLPQDVNVNPGEFSIVDWTGYPAGVPRPTGTFRLLEGAEYDSARDAANVANKALRKSSNLVGQPVDIHEVKPVKFNGSPTDSANKVILNRSVHRQDVTPWWNALQRALQGGQ